MFYFSASFGALRESNSTRYITSRIYEASSYEEAVGKAHIDLDSVYPKDTHVSRVSYVNENSRREVLTDTIALQKISELKARVSELKDENNRLKENMKAQVFLLNTRCPCQICREHEDNLAKSQGL